MRSVYSRQRPQTLSLFGVLIRKFKGSCAAWSLRRSRSRSVQLDWVIANLRCLRDTMCYFSLANCVQLVMAHTYLIKIIVLVAAVFTITRLRVLLDDSLS